MAADAVTWHEVVVGLVSGGVAGGTVSALVTARHERAERRKARRIDAADAFLQAVTRFRMHAIELDSDAVTLANAMAAADVAAHAAALDVVNKAVETAHGLTDELIDRETRLAIVFPRRNGVYASATKLRVLCGQMVMIHRPGNSPSKDDRKHARDAADTALQEFLKKAERACH